MAAMLERTPAAGLRDLVGRYCGFSEETGRTTRRREGPGAAVVVILSFGNEWRIGGALDATPRLEPLTSFVGGLRDTSVLTEHDGQAEQVKAELPLFGCAREPRTALWGCAVAAYSTQG